MKQTSTFSNYGLNAIAASVFLLSFLLFNPFSVHAQTSNAYNVDQTAELLTDLAGGKFDIYELSTSGGEYVLTGTTSIIVTIGRSATIRAKAGLLKKPIVSVSGTSTSATAAIFVAAAENFAIRLEGIEFNGVNANAAGGQPILFKTTTTALNCKVTVKNCYIHDFNNASGNGTIRLDATGSSMDIQETTFNNCNGRMLYFGTSDGNSTTTINTISNGDLILKNCTVSNMTGSLGNPNTVVHYKSTSGVWAKGKNATIDHCTFYNCTLSTDEIFKFRMMSGLISITNCIFDKVDSSLSFVNPDVAAPAQVLDFCYLGFVTPPTGTNTISKTPAYTDIAKYNFGLTNKSDFVGKDKLTVGDTRYYTPATSVFNQFQENVGFRVYPNPVSTIVNFEYSLNSSANIQLDLYSISGQLIKNLINNEYKNAGIHSKSIDVSNTKNGVYFARFTSGSSSQTIKLVVNN